MNFRPSAAHRWIGGGCTGSVKAEADAPRMPSTSQADEGNRLHNMAAAVLIEDEDIDEVEPGDLEVIGPYIKDVQQTAAMYNVDPRIEHWVEGFGMRGKVDASIRTNTRLIIWDLKTGMRPVEVIRNWQLILYALMMNPPAGMTIELRIAQEPPYHLDGKIRAWTIDNLTGYRVLVNQAIHEAKTIPSLVATPSNCLYCKAVANCSAARNVSLGCWDMAMTETGALPAAAVREELVALRNAVALGKSRLVALEAEAEARLRNGESIPGCTMKSGKQGKRAWVADMARVKEVCAMAGVAATTEQLLTPTQMIKGGVPEKLVEAISKRHDSKMTVSTDAAEITRKLFS